MRPLVRWCVASLSILGIPAVARATTPGVTVEACPSEAIAVEPGTSVQAAVDSAGDGATFCLKNGVHRMQVVRPKRGQRFYGEGQTILNGSRLLTTFSREGDYWVASGQAQRGQRHGECAKTAPTCDQPEGFFIDDKPFTPALSKDTIKTGQFYLDHASERLYFTDDPTGRKVEATVAAIAFESTAPNVLIRNIIVEKYANAAQKGAIQGIGFGWIIENCEARLNSGAGIGISSGGQVRGCNIHHNGQMGLGGQGRGIVVESNAIWANNIHGFNFKWEAGGVKFTLSNGVTFRGNNVYDNVGPGVWSDIDCRDVLVEGNLVERNYDAGIFHEISFNAIIRGNTVRHNGIGDRSWFWGADILVAASQDVQVYDNKVTVSPGGCGIILIDQGRTTEGGRKYKTRNNAVHHNEMTFEGGACAGGASDTGPDNENYSIIPEGNNVFDHNIYRVPMKSEAPRFVWDHAAFDWEGVRARGFEPHGRLEVY